ncbi:hypothetical protein LUZ60_000470 [Juncus effusus]|nr:hypothetical protein LUZ60_000470 [Juncus effusus]
MARLRLIFLMILSDITIHVKSEIPSATGFISIDCGIGNSTSYVDSRGIMYVSDSQYIDTGINRNISREYRVDQDLNDLMTLRTFPNGTKNCYSLNTVTKGSKYLLRATFYYGNYDKQNNTPSFDIYLGVSFWNTVEITTSEYYFYYEIIATAPADYIDVCLVNKGQGTPFISTLVLRPLSTGLYELANSTQSLVLSSRVNIGSDQNLIRYPDDPHDRLWFNYSQSSWTTLPPSNSAVSTDVSFETPSKVLQTAAGPSSTNESLNISWSSDDTTTVFLVVLHFAETKDLKTGASRSFYMYDNGELLFKDPFVPNYLTAGWAIYTETGQKDYNVSLRAAKNSTLPPILNALELYKINPVTLLPSSTGDVTAITTIKTHYEVKKGWSGDPCVPTSLSWTGVSCALDPSNIPTITSLDLSSSGLTGAIISAFGDLTAIKKLDLSGNKLSGDLPDFLDQLVELTLLDITDNSDLSTSLPPSLKKRQEAGTLTYRHGPKPIPKPNPLVPIVVSVVVILVVIAAAVVIFLCVRRRRNKIIIDEPANGHGGTTPLRNGHPRNCTSSPNSAQNLTRVHHKSLVSLMGYCIEGEYMALVYEYMPEGTLRDKLRDNFRPLTWKQRLRIAHESAQGLEYLHKSCNPPLVHRDVKTSNILLTANLEAKIADFGLVRAFDGDGTISHVSTKVVGTPGYLDPEYYTTSQLSEKSDVYSFGVVLLEIVTGQPPIIAGPQGGHLALLVRQKLSKGKIESIIDPKMGNQFNVKVAELGLKCTDQAVKRPTMTGVVAELKESLDLEMSCTGTYSGVSGTTSQYNFPRNDNLVSDVSNDSGFEMGYMGHVPDALGPTAR